MRKLLCIKINSHETIKQLLIIKNRWIVQVVKGSYMKYRQTLKRFEGEYQGLFREEIWGKYQKYQIAGPKQEPMEKKSVGVDISADRRELVSFPQSQRATAAFILLLLGKNWRCYLTSSHFHSLLYHHKFPPDTYGSWKFPKSQF